MKELVEFVRARLDEAEARVRDFEHQGARSLNGDFGGASQVYFETQWDALERLGVTPARVLADIEAKRRIVEQYRILAPNHFDWPAAFSETLELNLRALATVDADHPDFDPEWLA